jgi:pimeloyl-ACP methyl ester carboxylesterase
MGNFTTPQHLVLIDRTWGGRGACVAAALWPARVRALVLVGGGTVQNIAKATIKPESPEHELQFWYQWYFQTERGRQGVEILYEVRQFGLRPGYRTGTRLCA